MNFAVNLIAAVGIGFSVFQFVAGQQALGAAGVVLCCLVVHVNEKGARKQARRRDGAEAAVPEAAAVKPLRAEIDRLSRRLDALERAMPPTGSR